MKGEELGKLLLDGLLVVEDGLLVTRRMSDKSVSISWLMRSRCS